MLRSCLPLFFCLLFLTEEVHSEAQLTPHRTLGDLHEALDDIIDTVREAWEVLPSGDCQRLGEILLLTTEKELLCWEQLVSRDGLVDRAVLCDLTAPTHRSLGA